jgi:hypothetical protein
LTASNRAWPPTLSPGLTARTLCNKATPPSTQSCPNPLDAPSPVTPRTPTPTPQQSDHFTPKYLCYREAGGGACKQFDSGAVAAFKGKLSQCLGTLIEQGFKTIMITPHLDNAIDSNQWCAAWEGRVGPAAAGGGSWASGRDGGRRPSGGRRPLRPRASAGRVTSC